MSTRDQILLFQSAEFIVGPHGAALAIAAPCQHLVVLHGGASSRIAAMYAHLRTPRNRRLLVARKGPTNWNSLLGGGITQLKRYVHLGKAAQRGRVHCRYHAINVAVDGGPLRIAKHHDGNPAAFEVLLVLDIFFRREQDIETGFFS